MKHCHKIRIAHIRGAQDTGQPRQCGTARPVPTHRSRIPLPLSLCPPYLSPRVESSVISKQAANLINDCITATGPPDARSQRQAHCIQLRRQSYCKYVMKRKSDHTLGANGKINVAIRHLHYRKQEIAWVVLSHWRQFQFQFQFAKPNRKGQRNRSVQTNRRTPYTNQTTTGKSLHRLVRLVSSSHIPIALNTIDTDQLSRESDQVHHAGSQPERYNQQLSCHHNYNSPITNSNTRVNITNIPDAAVIDLDGRAHAPEPTAGPALVHTHAETLKPITSHCHTVIRLYKTAADHNTRSQSTTRARLTKQKPLYESHQRTNRHAKQKKTVIACLLDQAQCRSPLH